LHCRDELGNVAWSKAGNFLEIIGHGLQFIDFNKKIFHKEIFSIFDITNGGITYDNLLNMNFDDYEEILEETIRIQKEIKNKLENINE